MADAFANIESIGRVTAIAVVALYVLGLLIVNVYLYQLGISDFSVLRTRFVLTGALAVFVLSVIGVFMLTAVLAVRAIALAHEEAANEVKRANKQVRFAWSMLLVFVLSLFIALVYVMTSGIDFKSAIMAQLGIRGMIAYAICAGLAGVILSSTMRPYRKRGAKDRPSTAIKILGFLGPLLMMLFLFFWFVDFFAGSIYPIVPEQFGGGLPKKVQLVLTDEAIEVGRALNFGTSAESPVVRRVELIWETEQGYVVRDLAVPDGPVIQIDRDVVSAVIRAAATPRPQEQSQEAR